MTSSDWKATLKELKLPSAQPDEAPKEDEFITFQDLIPARQEALRRRLRQALSEVEELFREKKWEEVLALVYPVEEKLPELVEVGLDLEPRSKAAFALGQLNRFEEAIKELLICVEKAPENFHYHSSLAYTAYNSLYAASNREVFLRGKPRDQRIELAHKHFKKAQALRPDGVTNFYRQGMLYKQIEKKAGPSIQLFEKAIENWEALDQDTRRTRHQERKNYVKALYQLAGALLETRKLNESLYFIKKCLAEDETSEHISSLYKHFTLGKVNFFLGKFQEAEQALRFAIEISSDKPSDFVCELLARTYLAMGKPVKAKEVIDLLPKRHRKPYVRWTEADVLCALKDFSSAKKALLESVERDKRSAHKAYLRLARIEYLLGNYQKSRDYASYASKFFFQRWNGLLDEALFWEALNSYRLGDMDQATKKAATLQRHNPRYPKLALLLLKLGAQGFLGTQSPQDQKQGKSNE